MKKFKKINQYFFGDERIGLHDFLWFYGVIFYAFFTIVFLLFL